MNNKGLPSKKQWDKIVDDAFSSAENHEFSDRYERRRADLQKGIVMDSNERKRIKDTSVKKTSWKAVAGIAAVLALIPVSGLTVSHLAGSRLPQSEVEVSSVDETSAEVETVETEPETETEGSEATDEEYSEYLSVNEAEGMIDVNYRDFSEEGDIKYNAEFQWLPEGLERSEAGNIYGKYSNGYGGGMTPVFYSVPETGIHEKINMCARSEDTKSDDKVIVVFYRENYQENAPRDTDYQKDKPAHIAFNREVWVVFDNANYVQMFFVTDDISKEDVMKMAENIQLVPSETETACEWFDRDAPDAVSPSDEGEADVSGLIIGVVSADMNEELASQVDLPVGVYVRDVTDDTPAAKAGIEVGDIIVAVDDEPIESNEELISIKNDHSAGDDLKLRIFRDDKEIEVNVTLEEDVYSYDDNGMEIER